MRNQSFSESLEIRSCSLQNTECAFLIKSAFAAIFYQSIYLKKSQYIIQKLRLNMTEKQTVGQEKKTSLSLVKPKLDLLI